MPNLVPPMLATSGALPGGSGWGYEFKWDGVRAIAYVADGVRLLSRNDRDVTRAYPELGELSWAHIPARTDASNWTRSTRFSRWRPNPAVGVTTRPSSFRYGWYVVQRWSACSSHVSITWRST